jgi:hypothetical protein
MKYVDGAAPAVNGAFIIEHTVTCDLPDGQVCLRAKGFWLNRQANANPDGPLHRDQYAAEN